MIRRGSSRSSHGIDGEAPKPLAVRGDSTARDVAAEWTRARGSGWIRVDQGGFQPGEGGSTLIRRGSSRSSHGIDDEAPKPLAVRTDSTARDVAAEWTRARGSGWIRVDQGGF